MDVVLIGNSQPAVVLGEPDEDGNVRVAVFGGEQYVPKGDLYAVGGGPQPFADKPASTEQSQISDDGQQLSAAQNADDPFANAQPQPVERDGA